MRRHLIAPALLVACLAALAGCADDTGDAASSPSQPAGAASGEALAAGGAAGSDMVAPVGGDLRLGEPWYLVGGAAEELGAAAGATITFEAERVGGQAPVNAWSAGYTAGDDGALELGPIAATLMAGPEAAMAAETAYLAALDAADGYTAVAAGELYLFTGQDNVLVYSVTPPAS